MLPTTPTRKEQDTTGFEPVTAGSAILCSTTELSIRQWIHYFHNTR
eukprot:UN08472